MTTPDTAPIACSCGHHCVATLHTTPRTGYAVVGITYDQVVELTPTALRQHIAQCVRALAAIDPGDVAGETDLDRLRLRYYLLETIAGYAPASEAHLPEVRAALSEDAGRDLLAVVTAAERLVQQVTALPVGAFFLSSLWQELVAAVQHRRREAGDGSDRP